MSSSTPSFEPSCPYGGDWYACGNGAEFVGCCTSDPCNDHGCFQGNLRAASFLASAYGTFPDQQCDAGSWYTCVNTEPTFFGCCSINPCDNNGCPDDYLEAGYLSSNPLEANAFDPQPPLSASSSLATTSSAPSTTHFATSVSTSTSSTSSSNPTLQPTSSPSPIDKTSVSNTVSKSTIAGAAVGGALGILVISIAIVALLRRYRRRSSEEEMGGKLNRPDTGWSGRYNADAALPPSDTKASTNYTKHPVSYAQTSDTTSPMLGIHEADSREVSSYGSPTQSLGFRSEQRMSRRPISSLATRGTDGDGKDQVLELDGSDR